MASRARAAAARTPRWASALRGKRPGAQRLRANLGGRGRGPGALPQATDPGNAARSWPRLSVWSRFGHQESGRNVRGALRPPAAPRSPGTRRLRHPDGELCLGFPSRKTTGRRGCISAVPPALRFFECVSEVEEETDSWDGEEPSPRNAGANMGLGIHCVFYANRKPLRDGFFIFKQKVITPVLPRS